MGIVNLTPDSFSGDGVPVGQALARVQAQAQAGAGIVDLGAESTRPGAQPLDAEAEWARLAPVLRALPDQPWRAAVRLSVDTRHAATAAHALALGVDMVNDVGGLADPAMRALLAGERCEVVVMHALGLPADPGRVLPPQSDVVAELLVWKDRVLEVASRAGIDAARLVFDPGLGFGKDAVQSLRIVHEAPRLLAAGGRWLFGHSRKSLLRLFTEAPAPQRDDLSLALSARLAHDGVHLLRVHEVARHAAMFARLAAPRGGP